MTPQPPAAPDQPYAYVGEELEVVANASNWKSYLKAMIDPHLGDTVLEVGAGLGATTKFLVSDRVARWVALEPDPELAARVAAKRDAGELPPSCELRVGTLADLPPDETFSAILYVDVLEHIEDDRAELLRARDHLRPGGRLVVLAPAHNSLFSELDVALGHFRRYDRKSLAAVAPEGLEVVRDRYLDSVGILASKANRLLLKQSAPGPRQVAFWDRVIVPASRLLDPLAGYNLGKSLLMVWRKI